ncbi:hypothetical protein BC939DRAFT_439549 [Gamsiella multidivaricata]|uniref:uncharacterized protein n=1 Tax=Gamsiella multidivaricata TaxID=101098 RepID=UPI002220E40F|nr:uncharacterized protein BC939DRAFT_439549 [Gamsiella multidivaricata]KAG0368705.1 hypothetical protein BGZ54_001347 [Gamsiella multidivaricata]KAI7830501.1 hypothetical protein BC939DRAFT_439549 [Gamsiella multidivaricata]
MHLKSIATVLAVAGLAAAQTNTTELKHGQAHVDMNGIDATFTFDKVAEGMNITVSVAKGLTTGLLIQTTPPQTGFEYHIHDFPVGPNNNCTATGAHLDPAKVGVAKPCDPTDLNTCQTGDLAGKHGPLVPVNNATGEIPTINYIDSQLNFTGDGAMVGRSIVIHNNGTRIGCANLVVDGYTVPTTTSSAGAGAGTSTSSPTASSKPNSAAKLVGSVALSGLIAMMMMAL